MPKSIVSLASSPKPQEERVARRAGDSRFENAPANYHVFAAASVGEYSWVEELTLNFAAETTLTRIKSTNKDFVIEPGGTCQEGNSYTYGESCSLLVRFNPQGPGHRLGFLSIANSAEATPASLGLTGNGYAPVVSFTPAQITTVPGTAPSGTGLISGASALAVDGGDILYIADTGNVYVREIDSSGKITTIQPFVLNPPVSIAVDTFGYIYSLNTSATVYYFSYITPLGGQTAFGYAYSAGTCTESSPCAFSTVGMGSPANLSIDANDNLFFEERTKGAAEMPVAALSGGSGSLDLWYLSDVYAYSPGPGGESFAVDAGGNLYTSYIYNTDCSILEEPLYSAEGTPTFTRVAGAASCGFSGDGGQARGAEISTTLGQIAFDIAGDLYFADTGNQRVRRIDAATGIIRTIAGNGTAGYTGDGGKATAATLHNPTGVAVNSQGDVYIISSAASGQVIRKVGPQGYLSFPNQNKGVASAAQLVTVTNSGNSDMTLTNVAITGANPADFKIDNTTTTCVLTSGTLMYSGQTCRIGVIFTPAATGARAATLTLLDNTINGTDSVTLSGTGVLPTPTFKITAPANGASVTSGTAVTFGASVTGSGPQPTGTVQFKVDGANYGSAVKVSSTGTASTSVTGLTTTSHTLGATYSGDSNYAAAGPISVSITVKAAAVVKFTSPTAAQDVAAAATLPLKVTVTSKDSPAPTGNVTFSVDGKQVGAAVKIVSGVASTTAARLAAGTHTIHAAYSGDKYHRPATASETIITK
ncbi:MAG: Ig-like domain repeat protein [Candidatus Sulfotelmatobacter sp.]